MARLEKLNGMKKDLFEYFLQKDYNSVEVKQMLNSYLEDIGDYPLDSLWDIAKKQGFR